MKKIISINYQEMSEQAVARPQKAFREMDDVIKMDCIINTRKKTNVRGYNLYDVSHYYHRYRNR
jgi:hypothetical protein